MATLVIALLVAAPLALLLLDLARPKRARVTPAPYAGTALSRPRPVPRFIDVSPSTTNVDPAPRPVAGSLVETSDVSRVVRRPVGAAAHATLGAIPDGRRSARFVRPEPVRAGVLAPAAGTTPAVASAPSPAVEPAVVAEPVAADEPVAFAEVPYEGETAKDAAARRRRRGLAERRAARRATRRTGRRDLFGDTRVTG